MTEEWRDIPQYVGLYQASNYGRVRSVTRVQTLVSTLGKSYSRVVKGKILKTHLDIGGYEKVPINFNGKFGNKFVHRLVANAFLPNPDNLPEVNHKDKNRSNNHIDNLEWCTRLYNAHYGGAIERQRAMLTKPVYQMSLNGEIVAEYPSFSVASKKCGVLKSSIIRAARGETGSAGGYRWRYADDQIHKEMPRFEYTRNSKYAREDILSQVC